jgi:hypothetical protein
VRQVVVHLPAHPFHLLVDSVGQIVVSSGVGPLGFLCEHCQRGLQSVREIARFRDGPAHGSFAMVEQRVEVCDERLHFSGVSSVDATFVAAADTGELRSQLVKRGESPLHLPEPGQHAEQRHRGRGEAMFEHAVQDARGSRVLNHQNCGHYPRHDEQTCGPEHGAHEHA